MKNYKEYNKLIENAEFCLKKGNKTQAIHFYKEAQKSTDDEIKQIECEDKIYKLLHSNNNFHKNIDEAISETDVINLRENLKYISNEKKN